jgi:hypothetical protein
MKNETLFNGLSEIGKIENAKGTPSEKSCPSYFIKFVQLTIGNH